MLLPMKMRSMQKGADANKGDGGARIERARYGKVVEKKVEEERNTTMDAMV